MDPPFNTSFAVSVDWAAGSALPTYNFSIRQLNAVVWPADGRTYAYADIVSFENPYYPASYDSAIGVYSSADGHAGWQYHGIVLKAGQPGSWSAGGVATPGAAVVSRRGVATVLVSYTAESGSGGTGTRGIGLLSGTHPLGPFDQLPPPGLGLFGTCQSDDSQLVVDAAGAPGLPTRVDVFHRMRRNGVNGSARCGLDELNCTVGDCVHRRSSLDGGVTWDGGVTVRHAAAAAPGGWARGVWPLQELFDAKWTGDRTGDRTEDRTGDRLVRVNDNWSAQTPCAGKCLLVYLSDRSSRGRSWWPASPPTLQGSVFGSGAPPDLAPDLLTPQFAFIPDAAGRVAHMSVARFTNRSEPGGGVPPAGKRGAFTHFVYPVTRFG